MTGTARGKEEEDSQYILQLCPAWPAVTPPTVT